MNGREWQSMTYALSSLYPRSGYANRLPVRWDGGFSSFRYFLRYFHSKEMLPLTRATDTMSSSGTSNGA